MPMRFPLPSWSRRALLAAFAFSLLGLGGASRPEPSQGVARRAANAPYERGVVVVGFKAGVSGTEDLLTANPEPPPSGKSVPNKMCDAGTSFLKEGSV